MHERTGAHWVIETRRAKFILNCVERELLTLSQRRQVQASLADAARDQTTEIK